MADLPPELADFPTRAVLSTSLQQAFEGADVVGIHPDKALIGAWYGGAGFNVYDPAAWFGDKGLQRDQPNGDSGEVYHFTVPSLPEESDPEAEAREKLEEYGFEVVSGD